MKIRDKIYRFSDKKKYLFFSQLHSLLNSGLSFSRSFDLLIESGNEDEVKVLKKYIKRLFPAVNSGWH